jgi:hypothetical protein
MRKRKKDRGKAAISPPRASYSSLAMSGGLRAADGGTHEDKGFEARRVRVQRVSILSHDRSAL